MKWLKRFGVLIILLLIAIGFTRRIAYSQIVNERFFPQHGHFIKDDFWLAYSNSPEAEFLYGYPITEAFIDAETGMLMQYFDRARFELHPNAPEGERVQLSPLGKFSHEPGESFPLAVNSGMCREVNGFPLCLEFLRFYESRGADILGELISGPELEGERVVQYTTLYRMEYFPDGASLGQFILLF